MISKKLQQGFGILEMIISTFIVTLVVAVAATFFSYFINNYNFSFEENRILFEAETSIRRMAAEIREARTSENGAYPLVTADDQEIRFYSDVNNDGKVDRVRYFLSGSTLNRGVVAPQLPPNVYDDTNEKVSVISNYVVNGSDPLFYYYDGNWPGDSVNNPLIPANRLLDTRLVKINIKVNTGTGFNVADFVFGTEVMIRNLKTN